MMTLPRASDHHPYTVSRSSGSQAEPVTQTMEN